MSAHFSDASFKEGVTNSKLPVLVDFYAEWCGPCKLMPPVIEKLATEYEGKFKIGKFDVDANPEKSAEFMVQSIPTLIFFKDGREVDRLIGYKSEEVLRKKLESMMSPV